MRRREMIKTAFLFPGQGAQALGMGKYMWDNFSVARKTFEEANDILKFDLAHICFSGSLLMLNQLEIMYPAIVTTAMASYKVYQEVVGLDADYAVGHSLGELSALACSGYISFADALMIVKRRGSLINECGIAQDGCMCIVQGIEEKLLRMALQGDAQISCYNSELQFSISGLKVDIDKTVAAIHKIGGRTTPFFMSPPMHSSYMEPVRCAFAEELTKYDYKQGKWPVVSNYKVQPYGYEKEEFIDMLSGQLSSPVKWRHSLQWLEQQGVNGFIEIGHDSLMKNLVNMNYSHGNIYSFNDLKDQEPIKEFINYNGYELLLEKCLMYLASTPNQISLETAERRTIEQYYSCLEQRLIKAGESSSVSREEAVRWLINFKKILVYKKLSKKNQEAMVSSILSLFSFERSICEEIESI